MSFGQNIKKRRKELGLTLQDLATKTASSKSYIWELESKDTVRRPSALKIMAIASSLHVTSEWLLGGTNDNAPEAEDEAFYNAYKNLPAKEKKQLKAILEILKK